MEKLISAAQLILPIFCTVFLGMLGRKKAMFSAEEIQAFQRFVIRFCVPCLLFQSCLTANISAQALSSLALPPLLLLGTLFSFRLRSRRYPVHNLPMMFCCKETGMIGIPLFLILFGTGNAYHMGILDVVQAMIAFPVIAILTSDSGEAATPGRILGQMFRSPLLIMSLLGLTLNLSGIWDWMQGANLGGIVTDTFSFLSQPVSMIMLFCVGYNFSFAGESRKIIFRIAATHLAVFVTLGLIIQLLLTLIPDVSPMTRWAFLVYSFLPASYLTPGLGRSKQDFTVASGVCSVLTVVCLAVFCILAFIVA